MNKMKQLLAAIISVLFIAGCDELNKDPVTNNDSPKLTLSNEHGELDQMPVITGTRQRTILVGEEPDLLSGVQAIDPEDGDLTTRISVDNSNLDLTTPGHYMITYTVADSSGNRAVTYSLVEVKAQQNTRPVLIGIRKIKTKLGETPDYLSGIKATDLEDGNLTDSITVNDQNVDVNQKGSYLLSYSVSDQQEETTTEYTIVEVVSDLRDYAPEITGIKSITLTATDVEMDAEMLETKLLDGIEASDSEDGDLTSELTVQYPTLDETTPGTYLIHYEVVDTDGHKTTVPTLVTVVGTDGTSTDTMMPPIITGVQDFMVTVGGVMPDVLTGVTAYDEQDGDLTNHVTVNTNSIDLDTVGVYMLTYEVTDKDGNVAKAVSLVRVYDELTKANDTSIVKTVEAVYDGVVGITNTVSGQVASTGSGVIYKKDGNDYYVVTNHHVVDGAESVEIVYEDLSYQTGTLLGSDAKTDLAVIKISTTKNLPVLTMRDTETLQLGETAIAIGSPLGFEYYGSVTTGVISGLDRFVAVDTNNDDVVDTEAVLIQHDVTINPGNSGGALIDLSGNLIGINVLKIVEDKVSNMGFAIPIRTVKRVVSDLEAYGEVRRAYLGITATDVAPLVDDPNYDLASNVTTGVYIKSVESGSTAYDASLQVGDVIIGLDQYEVHTMRDLITALQYFKPGDHAQITYNRNGYELTTYVLFK